jgi:uncharacterized protein YecE (DUF72 family)
MYPWDDFYPAGTRDRDKLAYFVTRFDSVEINTTFYHLPKAPICEGWQEKTPASFRMGLKLHRSITHFKRMVNCRRELRAFFAAASCLGRKLGVVLLQLPSNFRLDVPRVDGFLADLFEVAQLEGVRPQVAIEPRHSSWLDSTKVLDVLRTHGVALVFAHSSRYPYPYAEPRTAGFVYLRFHGPRELFASEYGNDVLRPWAEKAARWLESGFDVWAYFNNDLGGHAHRDARRLRQLVDVERTAAALKV